MAEGQNHHFLLPVSSRALDISLQHLYPQHPGQLSIPQPWHHFRALPLTPSNPNTHPPRLWRITNRTLGSTLAANGSHSLDLPHDYTPSTSTHTQLQRQMQRLTTLLISMSRKVFAAPKSPLPRIGAPPSGYMCVSPSAARSSVSYTVTPKLRRGIRLPVTNLIQRSWVTGREVVEDAQPCTCMVILLHSSPLSFAFMVVLHDTSPSRFFTAFTAEPPQPCAVTTELFC